MKETNFLHFITFNVVSLDIVGRSVIRDSEKEFFDFQLTSTTAQAFSKHYLPK